jgi:predicted TIM-barrel enzyme
MMMRTASMMTATTTSRRELLAAAEAKCSAARKAERAGDIALRDAYLMQASDRYRALGYDALASWCLDPDAE